MSAYPVINFYQKLPAKYHTKKDTYKNYDQIRIDLQCRILVCGASGSGKSNILMNLIFGINAWEDIYLCVKNPSEPLYAFLIDEIRKIEGKLGVEMLHVMTEVDELPAVDEFDPKSSHLLIFDDVITEKTSKLKSIADVWVRGRKQGITSIFLTQSFFLTPQLIRLNCNIFIFKELKRVNCKRIMNELAMSVEPSVTFELYKKCNCNDICSFFMIDMATHDMRLRFRKNFEPLEIEKEE